MKSRVEDDFVAVPKFENRDDLIKWLEQKMNVELGKRYSTIVKKIAYFRYCRNRRFLLFQAA